MKQARRVVITGLGLATPLGLDLEDSWERILSGTSAIKKISMPQTGKSPIQAVGSVSSDDWEKIKNEFKEHSIKEGERRTLFALWAAKEALKDAVLMAGASPRLNRDRFGAIVATGLGINRLEDIHRWIGTDKTFNLKQFGMESDKVHRESILRNNSNRPAALIAEEFALSGYNASITTACASSSHAIGTGYRVIKRGDADMMVVGGTDSMMNPVGLVFFVLLRAAATSSDKPEEVSRPFDRKRSGLVMGEGAGMAILEEEKHALKRGARIYAELAGYGTSMDAYKVTAPHPKGMGAERSMTAALIDSGLKPDDIDYINAHGTSTKLNDTAETAAIKKVFKEHAYKLSVSSSKSITGHLLAASGAPEFVFTALSVNRDEIHPTINLKYADPKCNLDYVPNIKKQKTVRAALSNSFGFGGQNGTIIIKKYKEDEQ